MRSCIPRSWKTHCLGCTHTGSGGCVASVKYRRSDSVERACTSKRGARVASQILVDHLHLREGRREGGRKGGRERKKEKKENSDSNSHVTSGGNARTSRRSSGSRSHRIRRKNGEVAIGRFRLSFLEPPQRSSTETGERVDER